MKNFLVWFAKKRVLQFILATLFWLVILEIMARFFFGRQFIQSTEVTIPDLILNHKWRPNSYYLDQARARSYLHITNSQSWVEEAEVSETKPKETIRIFYVGDSNVQGVVASEKKMVEIIERELNKVFHDKGKRVEVINTGTTSYSPILYYLLIKNEILNYAPDLVVINVDMTDVVNDSVYRKLAIFNEQGLPQAVRLSTETARNWYRMTPQGVVKISPLNFYREKLHQALLSYSSFYSLFERKAKGFLAKYFKKEPSPSPSFLEVNEAADWQKMEWSKEIEENVNFSMMILRVTIELLKKEGVKVMLTGVPNYYQFKDEASSRPHEELGKTAAKGGVPYLNSFEALKQEIVGSPQAKYYWVNDPYHFNEEGNALWAKIQLAFILDPQNSLLPL